MKKINLYVTYYGVHGIIDDSIMFRENAQPKSRLYENISVPRLTESLGSTFDETLDNLFNVTEHQDVYNIGFFYLALRGETFKQFLDMCPSGTRLIFVRAEENDHNVYFRHFLNKMIAMKRIDIFKRPFRENKFTDADIKDVHVRGYTYVDDCADDYDASDWKPFEHNEKLTVREYIKP